MKARVVFTTDCPGEHKAEAVLLTCETWGERLRAVLMILVYGFLGHINPDLTPPNS